jgi:hypothetical protein
MPRVAASLLRAAAALAIASSFTPVAASCGSKSGGPTDSPAATQYGKGVYPWADSLVQWQCVYNIKDYPASSDDASFVAAQKDAVAGGGGVIYFPAGSYSFTTNLMLASNVVIRGAPTTAPAKSGKNPGSLAPATKFLCPSRSHLGIFSLGANNTGVVNIDSTCAIMLWPELNPGGQTFSWPTDFENYWFGAKSINTLGGAKLVLGNLMHDISFGYPAPGRPASGQNTFPWVFSTAIAAYSMENALVANNLVRQSDDIKSPVTLQLKAKNGTMVHVNTVYPTDDRYGIDVNVELIGAVSSAAVNPGGSCEPSWGSLTPQCFPWLFPLGIVIRDNYVHQNGRVGISFSSGLPKGSTTIGGGSQVFNNHVEVVAGTTCWTVDGTSVAGGSDTNENRGYNIFGE